MTIGRPGGRNRSMRQSNRQQARPGQVDTRSARRRYAAWRRFWFTPVLGPVLRDRRTAGGMTTIAVVQTVAALYGWRTFDCPMLRSTGIPCPGCGLSRACGAFVRGDWATWAAFHLFAPPFLLAAAILLAATVLPATHRDRLARATEAVEARYGVVPLLVAAMFVYWATRLIYSGHNFVILMRG
jgi:hypothetical protein